MSTTPSKTKNRQWWLAGLLNFVVPGLGFLYVGRPHYAFAVPGIMVAWSALCGLTHVVFSPLGFYFTLAGYGAISVGSIITGAILAKRSGAVELKPYQQWYVYLSYGLLCLIAMKTIQMNRGPLFGFDHYRLPSKSMSPTLQFGDFVLVNRWAYTAATPQRGDIVVFQYPKDPSISYVKRVIGLPGDRVTISGGVVSVNGAELSEPYVLAENNVRFRQDNTIFDLPAESYFMMGDNRDHSNDSRFWGPVKQDALEGKVLFVWLHIDPDNGVDLNRLGLPVK